MGIKTFFRDLGRGIKRGFNKLVSGAGDAIGGAATVLQRKIIPGIAGGATKASELLGKLAPVADAAGVGGEAAEAGQILGKVGDVTGKFAKFIGSDLPAQGTPMNEQQIAATLQSPLLMAFRRSSGQKPLDAAGAAALAANYTKTGSGLISPAPAAPKYAMGLAKPIDFSKMKPFVTPASASIPSSGIEAPPPANQPKIAVTPSGTGGIKPMLG